MSQEIDEPFCAYIVWFVCLKVEKSRGAEMSIHPCPLLFHSIDQVKGQPKHYEMELCMTNQDRIDEQVDIIFEVVEG